MQRKNDHWLPNVCPLKFLSGRLELLKEKKTAIRIYQIIREHCGIEYYSLRRALISDELIPLYHSLNCIQECKIVYETELLEKMK